MPRSTTVARTLLVPYLVVVGLLTLLPAEAAGTVTGIVQVFADAIAGWGVPRGPAASVFEFLANVALFAPFGMLVALAWPGAAAWTVIVSGCLLSVSIELMQIALPSRFPSIGDVIANTAGASIGYAVIALRRRSTPRP